jgi:serine/threonine protein kinase
MSLSFILSVSLFLCLTVLSRGAFSECRLAIKRKESHVKVVIKHIHSEYVLPQYKPDIEQEFNILSQLSHPNIVKLFEVYSLHGDYFMVPLLPSYGTSPSPTGD